MSAACIACQNPVRAHQQGLQCDGWFRWQHVLVEQESDQQCNTRNTEKNEKMTFLLITI